MRLICADKCDTKYLRLANLLYEKSFPIEERRDKFQQSIVEKHKDYRYDLVFLNGEFLGIALYWETPTLIFLEHLAILPEKRNGGAGSKVLSLFKEMGKPILLEIEPPTDSLTNRRLAFYERNGFKLNPYFHLQAKLKKGDGDVELKVLTYPEIISEKDYLQFIDYMNKEISAK